jgi:outer membrane lipoprotein-sorting protein
MAQGQENDLKAFLRKAIDAHGGEKNLNKYQGVTSKFKGTMDLMGKNVDVTGETSVQKPDKMKNVMTLDLNGKSVELTQVFDGKSMWISVLGKTTEIKDEKLLKEVRESLQAEGGASLPAFLEEPYKLSSLGEVKVKGKDTLGIRISKKGQRDFSLFFDKKTHLVAKTEMRVYDPMGGQEVTQEKFLSEYQEKNGLKIPRRVLVYKDDKQFMDLEVIESQPREKIDDAFFAMP